MRSVGWTTLAVILVSMVLMQVSRNGADIWLSSWVDQPRNASGAPSMQSGRSSWVAFQRPEVALGADRSAVHRRAALGLSLEAQAPQRRRAPFSHLSFSWPWPLGIDARSGHFLAVYAAIAAANSAFTLLRAFSFAYGGLHAARAVHVSLLKVVSSAPMAFFDANPIGQILNR